MAKKSAGDLRAAKQKKQKKIAIGGAVLLVILLAVQVPRTMKMLGGDAAAAPEPAPAAAAPAATAPAPGAGAPSTLAPPTLEGANPSAPNGGTTASGGASEQLVSFSRFESKDPFAQQVDPELVQEAKPPKKATADKEAEKGSGAPDAPDGGASAGGGAHAYSSAHVAVNGSEEAASVGTPFPAATPLFVLVSVKAKSAKIKVADGGSFAAGDATLTLELKRPVTLVNTADGTRYVLELRSVP